MVWLGTKKATCGKAALPRRAPSPKCLEKTCSRGLCFMKFGSEWHSTVAKTRALCGLKLPGYVFDHEHEAVFPFSRALSETTPCTSRWVLPMQVSTFDQPTTRNFFDPFSHIQTSNPSSKHPPSPAMGKTNPKTNKIIKRFSETARGKRQKFEGRKICIFRKFWELAKECDSECWGIVKRRNRFYLFNSTPDGRPPPEWNDIVR
jgi:hypothetical protein